MLRKRSSKSRYKDLENDLDVLRRLVESGDADAVQHHVVAREITPEVMNQFAQERHINIPSPVCDAAVCGHVNVLDALVEAGFPPEGSDSYNSTPIHVACARGHLPVVKSLVEKHCVQVDNDMLCSTHSLPVFKYLCEHGAAASSPTLGGYPLHHAIRTTHELYNHDLTLYILSQGCDPDVLDDGGRTALHHAAFANNVQAAMALLHAGANVDAQSRDVDETPLFKAARGENHHDLSMVKLLVSLNANPEIRNKDGDTVLHYCVRARRMKLGQFFVCNVNISLDNTNTSPLAVAVAMKDVRWVAFLLKAGCDPDISLHQYLYNDRHSVTYSPQGGVISDLIGQISTNTRPLVDLSVFTIRRLLGWNITEKVERLPVPPKLKRLLCLDQLKETG